MGAWVCMRVCANQLTVVSTLVSLIHPISRSPVRTNRPFHQSFLHFYGHGTEWQVRRILSSGVLIPCSVFRYSRNFFLYRQTAMLLTFEHCSQVLLRCLAWMESRLFCSGAPKVPMPSSPPPLITSVTQPFTSERETIGVMRLLCD